MPPRRPSRVTRSSSPTGIRQTPTSADRGVRDAPPAVATKSAPARPLEPLSARELEVLWLLRDGFSCSEIGVRLSISPRTAWAHLGALKRKLSAATAAHCVARGFERKLLK